MGIYYGVYELTLTNRKLLTLKASVSELFLCHGKLKCMIKLPQYIKTCDE